MANVDRPHGLAPLGRTLDGGQPEIQVHGKVVGYGTAIFVNDVVQRVAAGGIEPGVGALTVGVALNYGAASKATDHLVIVSPGAVYEAQDNADVDGTALADIGANSNLEANAGSATTEISGYELDESSYAVTSSLHVHLMQKFDHPKNAYGANCRVEVVFNVHSFGGQVTGVTT